MTASVQQMAEEFALLCAAASAPPTPAGGTPVPPGAEATPAAEAPAPPPPPVQIVDYAAKGYHLDVRVHPSQVVAAAALLDRNGFAIDAVTGVDWMAAGEMEVVYDYFHPEALQRVVVRARIPRNQADIPSIGEVFAGANWHERETHDFFGIRFLGHPNLTPLLLPEDADYHPLRKDFVA